MAKRKPISKKTRFEVFKRDSFQCKYCGAKAPDVLLEIDHIKPVSKGGENDITNLITACFDCNRGKGKREIGDKTEVHKQRPELERLQNEKEQLMMLLEWREELKSLSAIKIDKAVEYFEDVFCTSLTDVGISIIAKNVKRYDVRTVLEAIDIAVDRYDDAEKACNSLNFISKKISNGEDLDSYTISYAIGIMKNRFNYVNPGIVYTLFHPFKDDKVSIDSIIDYSKTAKNWTQVKTALEVANQNYQDHKRGAPITLDECIPLAISQVMEAYDEY